MERAGGDEWQDPEPFLRGVAWWDGRRPVRADPSVVGVLPWELVERASLPVGVRLELTASPGTRAVEVRYRARVPGPDGAGPPVPAHCFGLWRDGRCAGEAYRAPTAEEATVALTLPPSAPPGAVFTVYLPEVSAPVVLGLRGVGGAVAPAPRRPRWLVYGDSITEGWWATRPAHAWPAVAGRALGLDPVNLGYAGTGRGELPVARQLAGLDASLITLAFGTNCWGPVPTAPPALYELTRAFVATVRDGHPDTPLLVVSPLRRPDAEDAPNGLGATLAELRAAMEEAVRDLRAAGDTRLALLPGRPLLRPEHLWDGLHPNDTGHARLGAAVADAVRVLGLPQP
ncbi:GDSL-type esterase/lipase family protein [Streptomyces thermolilacinus]|uniref:GDSL family lipase n=1 Tax=Streptomyces thermolilacinus SPC6 TaxID=1306406 RepID=A0A1D3DXR6_9ACTN|nr:GDSL-type esterase/lipase family protein [Streptomyces thermolilacinus]OEJ97108.1 GDSL family lipase [Streptomyces thermolilacinus SPC6]